MRFTPQTGAGNAMPHSVRSASINPWRAETFIGMINDSTAVLSYIMATLCILVVVILGHHIRMMCEVLGALPSRRERFYPVVYVSRKVRGFFVQPLPLVTSVGHATLIGTQCVIDVTCMFANLNYTQTRVDIAARSGWLALVNLAMTVFMAMKNSPLTTFSPYSWEQLRLFHHFTGVRVMVYTIIHLSCHGSLFSQIDDIKKTALRIDLIFGIARAVLILIISATFLGLGLLKERIAYRLHVLVAAVSIAILGVHLRNSVAGLAIACLAASFWIIDLTIRTIRFGYFKYHSIARIVPLSNGTTRLTLDRAPVGTARGTHSFVRVPTLSRFQMRPMTIVNTDPFEFVAPSTDKWSAQLHKLARENPGSTIRASLEGPYGQYPDPTRYHELVCVAGGSGAAFTFGVALQMLATMSGHYQKVRFIWMVPYQENFNWYAHNLGQFRALINPEIKLYVTRTVNDQRDEIPTTQSHYSVAERHAEIRRARQAEQQGARFAGIMGRPPVRPPTPTPARLSPPRTEAVIWNSILNYPITRERPDVQQLIGDIIRHSDSTRSMLIVACGPKGLLRDVRSAAARGITPDGPSVELHCEQLNN